jgi:3D (Asp-Asp-Asp) domain-containing protein
MKVPLFTSGRYIHATVFLVLALASNAQSLSAQPTKGTATWPLYYVAELEGKEVSSGGSATVVTATGEKIRVQLAPGHLRKANLEGTAAGNDASGKPIVSNIIKVGLWEDLPDDWEGKGNRSNPLKTYRSVAADQRSHPFGSRIYVPELVGFTPPGFTKPHDGYLWVADVGGGIKGSMRFDGFVGKQDPYEFVMELENLSVFPKSAGVVRVTRQQGVRGAEVHP